MNTLIGILFNTRRTFQKLDSEFIDDLNIKTTIIFFVGGLGTGIKSILEEWKFFFDPSIWTNTLLLLISGLLGIVFGRYIISPIFYRVGKALKGKADFIDVAVVTAYSMIPTLIEVPITIYKVLVIKEEFTNLDYVILNSLYLFSWGLSIKILIQGLKDFNEFGTMKALINVSPMFILPILIGLVYYLAF